MCLDCVDTRFVACVGWEPVGCALRILCPSGFTDALAHLGRFAVKKIAVGESHSYLLGTLREARGSLCCLVTLILRCLQIRLLETLRHRNIVTYHHAWLETCQFSAFGPKVPTLQLS